MVEVNVVKDKTASNESFGYDRDFYPSGRGRYAHVAVLQLAVSREASLQTTRPDSTGMSQVDSRNGSWTITNFKSGVLNNDVPLGCIVVRSENTFHDRRLYPWHSC